MPNGQNKLFVEIHFPQTFSRLKEKLNDKKLNLTFGNR